MPDTVQTLWVAGITAAFVLLGVVLGAVAFWARDKPAKGKEDSRAA